MPGPGAHLGYCLGTSLGLMHLSDHRFSPAHALIYALNGFFGPDIGSFCEWLAMTSGAGEKAAAVVMRLVHDPLGYAILMGAPLGFAYSRVTWRLVREAPLNFRQCSLLVVAGGISHFFLDNLFEEEGRTPMMRWVISTGWWETDAPVDVAAVLVVGALSCALLGGFAWMYRSSFTGTLLPPHFNTNPTPPTRHAALFLLAVLSLYCLWCIQRTYWSVPRIPAVGEEADLGVLVFLGLFFFLPHSLCIAAMHPRTKPLPSGTVFPDDVL
ncbi:hypothetical protein KFL_001040270 [Klebsormidium nitens]|uniref:Uncharacterized protein n=1 Tax=Klebsormidium nitens TaxID=105231 RepID=A0A1Y1HUC7_KLENI|nr:hypothetical protein KFL_001040270 [Klebsormidium nitens]|eukprot:GAQ82224.1 hypothetical protein KFL_001040270 [Klebsormidium nitens]